MVKKQVFAPICPKCNKKTHAATVQHKGKRIVIGFYCLDESIYFKAEHVEISEVQLKAKTRMEYLEMKKKELEATYSE